MALTEQATSALDNQTESEVMQAIARLRGDKTIIIIAHRLSTIANCDCIFFLSGGRLLAQGSYTELLRDSPEFRAFSQSS
jgi:ATP-binding cassette, subfamily B, bacterial PglK